MEVWILVGLVAFTALCVAGLMVRLRFDGEGPTLPPWIAGVLLGVIIVILGASLAMRSWLTVASFTLLAIVWAAIFVQARRGRGSA